MLNREIGKYFFPSDHRKYCVIKKCYKEVVLDPSVEAQRDDKKILFVNIPDEDKKKLLKEIEALDDFRD